jgi:hypothetical protein
VACRSRAAWCWPPSRWMFNVQPRGTYLEFRLGPRIQPAVDSRIELLPAERRRWYLAVAAGRWDAERLPGHVGASTMW